MTFSDGKKYKLWIYINAISYLCEFVYFFVTPRLQNSFMNEYEDPKSSVTYSLCSLIQRFYSAALHLYVVSNN